MTTQKLSYRELLTHPQLQQLVDEQRLERIAQNLSTANQKQAEPIYIRFMIICGAWSISLFAITFFVLVGLLRSEEGAIIFGIIFAVAAALMVKRSEEPFPRDLSLSFAFTGNLLFVLGMFGSKLWGNSYSFSTLVWSHALFCLFFYFFYENKIYRFAAPLTLAGLLVFWLVERRINGIFNIIIVLEAILVGILFLWEKSPLKLKPLAYAAAASLPASLLSLNLTQMRQWRHNFTEPLWPAGMLLACGLLYLLQLMLEDRSQLRKPWFILTSVSTLLLGALTTPGILVVIGLMVLGFYLDDRVLTLLSYLFLPCFLVLFYYALNIDLFYKSWVIAGSGLLLLLLRWALWRLKSETVS